MSKRDIILYVWIRLLIQAGKTNAGGNVFLNENISYSSEMLSIIFNRPIEDVEFALNILIKLKMIEIDEDNFINISNWEKHQNIEGMDKIREQTRKRVERYREKNKSKENVIKENNNDKEEDDNAETNYKKSACNKESISHKEGFNEQCDYCNSDTKNNSENDYFKNCSVTVTEQNKKENKNRNRNRNRNKIEKEKRTEKENKIEFDIMEYIKRISKKFVGISLSTIKSAVSIHGEKNVKMAIDKAVEVNIPTMNYINGILKNWQNEGYPTIDTNSLNSDARYQQKKHKVLSFNNFEPRQYDYDVLEKALLGW